MRLRYPFYRPYRPNRLKLIQLSFAGAVSAVAMTLFSYAPWLIGFGQMDFPGLYQALFWEVFSLEVAWSVGLAFHLVAASILFPLIYDYLLQLRILANIPFVKGVVWGIVLWFVFEGILKPAAGAGFFSNRLPDGSAHALFGLLDWIFYGVLFESATRVRVVHHLHLVERHAA